MFYFFVRWCRISLKGGAVYFFQLIACFQDEWTCRWICIDPFFNIIFIDCILCGIHPRSMCLSNVNSIQFMVSIDKTQYKYIFITLPSISFSIFLVMFSESSVVSSTVTETDFLAYANTSSISGQSCNKILQWQQNTNNYINFWWCESQSSCKNPNSITLS